MSTFDVLERYGTWALLKVVAAMALFLALHLIRIPFVLIERVLAGVLHRVDGYAVRHATTPPTGPINHFYAHPNPAAWKDNP